MDDSIQQPTPQDQQQRAMYAMLLRQQGQQPAGPGVAGGLTSAAQGIMQGIAMHQLMRPGLFGRPAGQPAIQPAAPNYAGPDAGMLSATA